MSLKIKGVNVIGNQITGEMFDVSVDVVKMGSNPDRASVVFTREDNEEEFASLVVRHPELTIINNDNWADLLVLDLLISEKKEHLIPRGLVKKNGVYKVTTKPSLGQRFFRFHGKGQDYVILVDFGNTPRSSKGLRLDNAFGLSEVHTPSQLVVTLFHDKIRVETYVHKDENGRPRSGYVPLTSPLDTMEQFKVYLGYNISQVLYERAKQAVLEGQPDDQEYIWKTAFNFYYIESRDKVVSISPWDDTLVNLLWTTNDFLLNHDHDLMKEIRRSTVEHDSSISISLFKKLKKLHAAVLRSKA